jgi:hypothetical protein
MAFATSWSPGFARKLLPGHTTLKRNGSLRRRNYFGESQSAGKSWEESFNGFQPDREAINPSCHIAHACEWWEARMSWHTSALLIKADFSKNHFNLFKMLGLNGGEASEIVSFDDASSGSNDGLALGSVAGWTALWGALEMVWLIDDRRLDKLAKKADIFWMILEGTSDTAGFTWWTGGKKVRDWMSQAGEVIKNEGKALPEEKKAFAKKDEEQGVLQMLMSLTLPLKSLEAIQYQMYEFPEDAVFDE